VQDTATHPNRSKTMQTKQQTTLAAGERQLVGWVLEDIKAIWDDAGFGEDEAVSEPLYARLEAAIRLCQHTSEGA
jgi:hypothetical protein